MADHSIPQPLGLSQLPTTNVTGIYFLWHGAMVVYVGQSKTIAQRVYQHIQDGTKAFDGLSWIACEPKHLNGLERRFIERLLPRYNRCLFSERVRREKPWRPDPESGNIATFLGLTQEQFIWVRRQPWGPRPGRIPRARMRRWTWDKIEAWAAAHADLIAAAKSMDSTELQTPAHPHCDRLKPRHRHLTHQPSQA